MRIVALALGLVVVAGACASSGTAAGDQTPTSSTTTRRTNIITAQEIRESTAPSLPDLIRQLRPSWPGQGTQVTIVVNNDIMGGYAMLSQQPKSTASEIRFLTRSEAQTKWGARVQEVIQVITR
ncbi:MAG TPA: hypothetical protein VFD64_12920 [Gemmatimonadaceae bacterium]|jgi:hypothetical protein|nr:hypothetical protein [Gemmatimonadaceae bacterium]